MAKTQSITPTIAEFDDWDETKETEALAEVAKQVKVRHIIKNNEYWALTPGGTVYKLPLYLSIADFCRILNSEDGVRIRADFARFGWSVEHDLGRRLPYRDAIDLYTALCGDPASYTGASLIGLMFPMSATDITVLQLIGASTLLGDVDGEPETDEPTAEEIHEAESHMSKLFG